MFSEIRIRGLGIIDEAVLELSPGLNVLTGETGAGKTMVVSGLGLLLGNRADSGLVRASAPSASVEGVLSLTAGHPALDRAEEAGGSHDGGELVVARTLSATGRSRAHVGGRTVPVAVLAEMGELLVAVHGQADQWRLRQGEAHRQVLDEFGGAPVLGRRRRVEVLHERWRAAAREHAALLQRSRERARDADSLTASLEEIEAVDPQRGEDAALRLEEDRLAHVDALRTAVSRALASLNGDDDEYAAQRQPGARDLLAAAAAALRPAAAHDVRLGALGDRLGEVATLADDLAAELGAHLDGLDADPGRLAVVQARRAALRTLTRKYGEDVDEVLEWSRSAARRLEELIGAEDRVDGLAHLVQTLGEEVVEAALELSEARRQAARELAARVTAELAHLAMGRARLEVRVEPVPDSGGVELRPGQRVRLARHGADEVEILLAANAGAPPRSLAKSASGGELSRVMLALEVVGASRGGPPTFVFDEVDAGVGGRAALDVGARLARLAEHAQVIVVTHLAQVAAFADRHLVVSKSAAGSVTSSSVALVEADERLRELSRMMGGDPDSEAGLAHALDLLEQTAGLRMPA